MKKELTNIQQNRRNEIVLALEKLYKKKGFKDITIKDIAKETTFTRASIYNYYETKEEIFLDLYTKEFEKWTEELELLLHSKEKLTKKYFIEYVSKSLEKREQLLKLMSMNNYDMEENSRLEFLVEFKKVFINCINTFSEILIKYDKKYNKESAERVTYAFFPFIYGLYPYSHVTSKQKKAMDKAGHKWQNNTTYKLTCNFLNEIL